jgi:DNA-directed RNA polymerase specialized sigma24 family protein
MAFLTWLDEGVDSGGEKYIETRRRLVSYFARKRCASYEDLADETLNRVARRLEEEQGVITDASPVRYCYIVARFVYLESLRSGTHGPHAAAVDAVAAPVATQDEQEALHLCLEDCLGRLSPADRDLILEYYGGGTGAKIRHRRELSARLSLTANALTIRACRIRDKLETCVAACADG